MRAHHPGAQAQQRQVMTRQGLVLGRQHPALLPARHQVATGYGDLACDARDPQPSLHLPARRRDH